MPNDLVECMPGVGIDRKMILRCVAVFTLILQYIINNYKLCSKQEQISNVNLFVLQNVLKVFHIIVKGSEFDLKLRTKPTRNEHLENEYLLIYMAGKSFTDTLQLFASG